MLAIMDNLSLQDSFQVNQVLLEKKRDTLRFLTPPALPTKETKQNKARIIVINNAKELTLIPLG